MGIEVEAAQAVGEEKGRGGSVLSARLNGLGFGQDASPSSMVVHLVVNCRRTA